MGENLVANELLAFLQQKLDVMDELSALQICKTNFSEDDVATAKKLLYESLGKSDQMVSRRRDGTPKSLQEIITLLKVTDPDDVPTFVARDLNKLPPVTFDHVDVTCLLKDIVSLKASLAEMMLKFQASENTVSELRKEVDDLRESLAVCRSSTSGSYVNTRRGACLDTSSPSSSCKSAVSMPSTPRPDQTRAPPPTTVASAVPAPRRRLSPARALPSPPLPAAVTLREPVTQAPPTSAPVSCQRNFAAVAAAKPCLRSQQQPVSLDKRGAASQPVAQPAQNEEDFVEVRNKKRHRQRASQNRCGTAPTGPNYLLRAAIPTTAVYLSRLHHSTTTQDVTEYIRIKTNLNLRVQFLEPRHNTNFKAFVVRIPTDRLDSFLKENFWPQGVVFRRFRGTLPCTTETARKVLK